jgi:TPR repeat protein
MSTNRAASRKWIMIGVIALVLCVFAWLRFGRGSELDRIKAGAAKGEAEAEFQLAGLYAEGKSVPLDKAVAADWLYKAAKQGHAAAQFKLGEDYELGRGVKADYGQSFHWFQESANQGYPEAETCLGMAYELGEGVEKDYLEAYKWLQLAVTGGDTNAVVSLKDLSGAMKPEEIAAAKKKVSTFTPKKAG